MTVQQLEAGKKLQDAISDNRRVLEHLRSKKTDTDKIEVLVNFLTRCGNLHASVSKKDLAQLLYDNLVGFVETLVDSDQKALEAL